MPRYGPGQQSGRFRVKPFRVKKTPPPAPHRSVALAQREGGIVHLRHEPREAGIGRQPHHRQLAPGVSGYIERTQHRQDTLAPFGGRAPHVRSLGQSALLAANLAGVDVGRFRHPIRGLEQFGHRLIHPPPAPKLSANELARQTHGEIGIPWFPGRRAASVVEEAIAPVARQRTRLEAELRLKTLDKQQKRIYEGIAGKRRTVDVKEQNRRNRVNRLITEFEKTGKRSPGTAKALREGRQPTLSSEIDKQVEQHVEKIIAEQPNHPAVKGLVAIRREAAQLREALGSTHMPGEEPIFQPGELGRLAPGELSAGEEAVRKAFPAMRTARTEQEALRSAERSQRVSRAQEAGAEAGGGRAGHRAELGQLKGELPKSTFTRLKEGNIGQDDLELLFKKVDAHEFHPTPKMNFFRRLNARQALENAFTEGKVPTKSEQLLLREVFGQDAEALNKFSHLQNAGLIVTNVLNIPRAMMASVDVSAPFRQGLLAGAAHPRLFFRNFKPMFKALGSERAYQGILDDIHSRPNADLYHEAGVKFTELGHDIAQREEQFMSSYAETLTGGKYSPVHASGRAYTGFLDKMRADMFDYLVESARANGVNVEDRKFLKSLGSFVNKATGRGDLGKLESWAPMLNTLFFSPRLAWSRINILTDPLNPNWYANTHPFVRKQQIRASLRLMGAAATILGAASYAGAKVVMDPRNSDFAKIKLGNTRVDVLGGFQQYVRLVAQISTGKIISSTSGKTLTLGPGIGNLTRKDIIQRFVEGKLAPALSFVNDFFKGTQFDGQPFDVKKAALQRVIPLVLQDAYDLQHEKNSPGLTGLGYFISAFGVGMQTYGPQLPKKHTYGGRSGGGSSNPLLGGGGGSNPLLPGGGSSSNPLLP